MDPHDDGSGRVWMQGLGLGSVMLSVLLLAIGGAAFAARAMGLSPMLGGDRILAVTGGASLGMALASFLVGLVLARLGREPKKARVAAARPVTSPHRLRIVVAPDVHPVDLDRALTSIGLAPCFEHLRRGQEPAALAWCDGEGRLGAFYTFGPRTRLRLLDLVGPDAADLAARVGYHVRVLDDAQLWDRMIGPDRDEALFALSAAAAVEPERARVLSQAIVYLSEAHDPIVSELATGIAQRLGLFEDAYAAGRQQLGRETSGLRRIDRTDDHESALSAA